MTSETEDEGRLIEHLLNSAKTGGETSPLAVIEPILTVARITQQPADWTFTARIWTEGLASINRSWSKIAEAIHGPWQTDHHSKLPARSRARRS